MQLFDEAANCLRQVLKLIPDSAEGHNNLGVALQRVQRVGEATKFYKRAIELQPD